MQRKEPSRAYNARKAHRIALRLGRYLSSGMGTSRDANHYKALLGRLGRQGNPEAREAIWQKIQEIDSAKRAGENAANRAATKRTGVPEVIIQAATTTRSKNLLEFKYTFDSWALSSLQYWRGFHMSQNTVSLKKLLSGKRMLLQAEQFAKREKHYGFLSRCWVDLAINAHIFGRADIEKDFLQKAWDLSKKTNNNALCERILKQARRAGIVLQ